MYYARDDWHNITFLLYYVRDDFTVWNRRNVDYNYLHPDLPGRGRAHVVYCTR